MNKILKAKIVEKFGTQADFAAVVNKDDSYVSRVRAGKIPCHVHPGGKGTPSSKYDYEPLPPEISIRPDGSKRVLQSRRGFDIYPLEHDETLEDFNPAAYRKRYIEALFKGETRWIKHFESMDGKEPVYNLIGCRRTNRNGIGVMDEKCIEKNLKLRAELHEQILNNHKYRKAFYEAYYNGESTNRYHKYLYPEVRNYIYYHVDWRNSNEHEIREVVNVNGSGETPDDKRGRSSGALEDRGKATGVFKAFEWSSIHTDKSGS